MKNIVGTIISLSVLLNILVVPLPVQATSAQELIQTLKQQIEELIAQVQALQTQLDDLKQVPSEVKETTKEIKGTIKLVRHLRWGMSGEDVTLLQETLATDPEVYPEGLVTGYFGPLTYRAVKKFQKMAGIEQVGLVGPKTTAKINELLTVGAGKSGKVPPGLLIAPGIRKKLGFTPQPLAGQKLPPGIAKKLEGATTTPDTIEPVISDLTIIDITDTSANITWTTNEEANSKLWYSASPAIVIGTSTPAVISTDLVLNHELSLTGLTASTTYYYVVTSADAADNIGVSTEESFTTPSELLFP